MHGRNSSRPGHQPAEGLVDGGDVSKTRSPHRALRRTSVGLLAVAPVDLTYVLCTFRRSPVVMYMGCLRSCKALGNIDTAKSPEGMAETCWRPLFRQNTPEALLLLVVGAVSQLLETSATSFPCEMKHVKRECFPLVSGSLDLGCSAEEWMNEPKSQPHPPHLIQGSTHWQLSLI
ncbi:hypothetical protein LX36DRAFT_24646 [Colletotrichum falcatum]|nr:hypothetical protein LX36DRAFT_24646 [Colletotrichum falcatum]